MISFIDDLKVRFKAGDPLIYIRSSDIPKVEQAIQHVLKEIRDELNKTDKTELIYASWSYSTGWMIQLYNEKNELEKEPKQQSGTDDPVSAFKYLTGAETLSGAYIIPFGNLLFDANQPNLGLLQDLLHSVDIIKHNCIRVVIVSPVFNLPKEIINLFTLIDFSLPQTNDLLKIFDALTSDLHNEATQKYGENQTKVELPSRATAIECAEAALGMTEFEAENTFAYTFYVSPNNPKTWDSKVILTEKANLIKKTGFLEYFNSTSVFSNIGGLDSLKVYLQKRIKGFSQEARDFGLPYPRGILLGGPPRVGKSLTAKAIANEFGVPLIRFDVGKIMGSLLGEASRNINTVISTIETIGKVVLWIDEIEKALAGMSPDRVSDSAGAEVARTLGTFLTWMQERDESKMIFIVGTSNSVLSMPPELTGKGRFDEFFWVDFPSAKEREEIFKIHLRLRNRKDAISDNEIVELAKLSQGYNGAEIEEAIKDALYNAFDNDEDITAKYLQQTIENTTPIPYIRKEEMLAMRQWAILHNVRSASSDDREDLEKITARIRDRKGSSRHMMV